MLHENWSVMTSSKYMRFFIPWHIFILQNKIKGYISHQHQKLVVSKQNAFPKLSTVLWSQTFSWLRLRSISPDCLFKMKLLSLLRKVHLQDVSDKFKVVSMILYHCVNCFEITDSSKNTKEIVLNYSTIGNYRCNCTEGGMKEREDVF